MSFSQERIVTNFKANCVDLVRQYFYDTQISFDDFCSTYKCTSETLADILNRFYDLVSFEELNVIVEAIVENINRGNI